MLMAAQQKSKRPIGVTLLGYLLLIISVSSITDLISSFKNGVSDGMFLGFSAPFPLPEIELFLLIVGNAIAGVLLLKLNPLGRITALAVMTWNLVSLANGMIVSNGPVGDGVTFSSIISGEAQKVGAIFWAVSFLVAAGLMVWIIVYLAKSKKYFVGEEDATKIVNDETKPQL